ncbi:MAG TPA: hypothetical protein VM935_20430, partial [Chitinophagaceae bacterium]|nr:hypothetical protein [Chitinophagaceae bacterium]
EKPSAEYLLFQTRRPAAGAATAGAPRPQPPVGPHDVPWGKGISNIKGVLQELKRQKFKGPIFAEYEHNWMNNAPEIAESIKYVRNVVKEMK